MLRHDAAFTFHLRDFLPLRDLLTAAHRLVIPSTSIWPGLRDLRGRDCADS